MVKVKVDGEQMYNGKVYTPDIQGYIDVPQELAEALSDLVEPVPALDPETGHVPDSDTPPTTTTTTKKK
jgi:hypothetical protein